VEDPSHDREHGPSLRTTAASPRCVDAPRALCERQLVLPRIAAIETHTRAPAARRTIRDGPLSPSTRRRIIARDAGTCTQAKTTGRRERYPAAMTERDACALLKARFEAAGYQIAENQPFAEEGIQFEIDGFDADARVGYEYVTDEAGDTWDVDDAVVAALAAKLREGTLSVLVVGENEAPDTASLARVADAFLAALRPAKKVAAKKRAADKAPVKKSAEKKAPAKKATDKKAPAKKTVDKKTSAKKAVAKKK
jgi:hypothetical protein